MASNISSRDKGGVDLKVKVNINISELSKINEVEDKKTLVLVGGCFDILHPGHIAFLIEAKKYGTLVILLESDKSIKKRKGDNRPVNTMSVRANNLLTKTQANIVIQLPFPFTDHDYDELVTKIKPAIIATTKGDPDIHHKKRQANLINSKVIEVIARLADHSTTNILK